MADSYKTVGRRSQATIYLVIGVLLVLVVTIFFFATSGGDSEPDTGSSIPATLDLAPIKSYMESCIEDIAVPVVYEIASSSGYSTMPPRHLVTDYSSLAYYYDKGWTGTPSNEDVRMQIWDQINMNLPRCIAGLRQLREYDIGVEGSSETDVILGEEDITIDVNLKIAVDREVYSEINSYVVRLPIRLKHVLDVARDLTATIEAEPHWMNLNDLADYDVQVSMLPHNSSVLVFSLYDESSNIQDEPFIFLFAARFDAPVKPDFELLDRYELVDGEYFEVKLDGPGLMFSDDTAMFDISSDGMINFTPYVTGEFDVTIYGEDDYGLVAEKTTTFVVTEADPE